VDHEAGEKIAFQGLPARICWLGYGERGGWGCASTRWCVGELSAPS
jgi:urocanate hydratase